jgi:1-deoxy-D-xylulose-5-phosphate reductoisomerase
VAGLEATHAAILAGKPVGLANKECMVAAGEILTAAARERNVPILPIDSEHNAVHQCLRVGAHGEVKTIWLTASGGPFRQLPLDQFAAITPEQALKHPTWVMGRRITIDSATMLNKGLEVIEACRLFDVPQPGARHGPSAVHGAFAGGVCGRLDPGADLRHRHAPAHSLRAGLPGAAGVDAHLRPGRAAHLDFEQPDFERFPCLRLAFEAAEKGGAHCIALNAADEVAVEAFLDRASRLPASRVQLKSACIHAGGASRHHRGGARRGPGGASNGSCAARLRLPQAVSARCCRGKIASSMHEFLTSCSRISLSSSWSASW